MKNMLFGLSLIFALSFALLSPAPKEAWAEEAYSPDGVLVKFRTEVSLEKAGRIISLAGGEVLHRFRLLNLYHVKAGARGVKGAAAYLKGFAEVEYAEPDYVLRAGVFPNDPSFGSLWGLHITGQTGGAVDADIDAPEAWDITTGGPQAVAVVDTGIDYGHQDLRENIWVNPGEDLDEDGVAEASDIDGLDNDSNGFVDDLIGWDFVNNDNDPYDDNGHGTHVAGTIAASGNNGVGVAGVNWSAKLMPLKFLDSAGYGYTSDAVEAIEYYTEKGVRVSNNSWGGGGFSQSLMDAIASSKGLFVAAAGNGASDTDAAPHYPSSYALDNIVSVAATDHNDALVHFSNYGLRSVDLGAPGQSVLSTTPGGIYESLSGTSMAVPHVSGAASLLLSYDLSLTVNEMKWRLLKGADPKSLPVLTGGRLNARNSLAFGLSEPAVTVDVEPLGTTTVSGGGEMSYSASLTNNTQSAVAVNARTYAQLPDGSSVALDGPAVFVIAAGQTLSRTFTRDVPAGAPPGAYTVFGQARTPGSFDEDPAGYTVVP